MKNLIISIILVLTISGFNAAATAMPNYLGHLDKLTDTIKINNQSEEMLKVYTYAKYPAYKPIGAINDHVNGLEGEACVDDVARAVIAYCKHYSYYKDSHSLIKARQGLNFVMYMQAEDGEFYNFMLPGLKISKNGPTSYKAINFWGARAIWSLAYGYSFFSNIDKEYAAKIANHLDKGIDALGKIIDENKDPIKFNGTDVPKWMKMMGSDCMSVCVLGLVKYYEIKPCPKLKNMITHLCDVIMKTQFGSFVDFPYSAYISYYENPYTWHGWGNTQGAALTLAGKALNRKDWIASAEKEVINFYSHILSSDFVGLMDPYPDIKKEQIAYSISPMIMSLMSLYQVTGKIEYAQYAGLTSSWFYGNNIMSRQMFNPATGMVYDGMHDNKVNLDSGAESTIECIMALMDVENDPVANKYIKYKEIAKNSFQIIKNDPLKDKIYFQINTPAEYIFYIQAAHPAAPDKEAGYIIDGKLSIKTLKSALNPIKRCTGKIFLSAGDHNINLKGYKKSVENIIIQPVIESKTLMDNTGNIIILLRDFEKKSVRLYENK